MRVECVRQQPDVRGHMQIFHEAPAGMPRGGFCCPPASSAPANMPQSQVPLQLRGAVEGRVQLQPRRGPESTCPLSEAVLCGVRSSAPVLCPCGQRPHTFPVGPRWRGSVRLRGSPS